MLFRSIHSHLRFLRAASVGGGAGVPQLVQNSVSGFRSEPQRVQKAFMAILGVGGS